MNIEIIVNSFEKFHSHNHSKKIFCKIRLLLALSIYTGIPLTDLYFIKWIEIVSTSEFIFVFNHPFRNYKIRIVPLSKELIEIINNSYGILKPLNINDYIFDKPYVGYSFTFEIIHKHLRYLFYMHGYEDYRPEYIFQVEHLFKVRYFDLNGLNPNTAWGLTLLLNQKNIRETLSYLKNNILISDFESKQPESQLDYKFYDLKYLKT